MQALSAYDAEMRGWRKTAEEYVAHQKTRTLLERLMNRSPAVIFVAPAVVVPAIGWLIWYLMQQM